MNRDAGFLLIEKASSEVISSMMVSGDISPSTYYEEYTPLGWAIIFGRLDLIGILLSWGSDIDVVGLGGEAALTVAINHDRLDIQKDLLKSGANPNYQELDGQTALMVASKSGNAKAVMLLLSFGADPNVLDNLNRSALRWLSAGGDFPSVAKILVDAGADSSSRDSIKNFTPLNCAVAMGFKKLSSYLSSVSAT